MGLEIRKELVLGKSPNEVYALLSEPKHLEAWFSDKAERDGDSITFTWNMEDGSTAGYTGKVITEDAGKRFAYESDYTVTAFDIEANGAGSKVVLVESNIPDQATYDEHVGGWAFFFSRLKELAS